MRFCEGLLRLEPLIAKKFEMKGSEKSRQSLLDADMRLLLVEDEKRMAEALCELLRLEKYDVDHYASLCGRAGRTGRGSDRRV